MTRLLSVSKAARLAGVSRSTIQREIRNGKLATFEGKVSIADLKVIYPTIELEDAAVLERMARIQQNAISKLKNAPISEQRVLAEDVERLRLELDDAYATIDKYRRLVLTLKQRLIDIQQADDCTRQQRLVLQALVTWLRSQMERRH